jgi:FemAB-related protein (PEP-CTERM system-associated)
MNQRTPTASRSAPTVRLLEDRDLDGWDRYVKNSSDASCYHLSCWKRIVEETFGHRTHYLLAEDDRQQFRGILPLVHLKSLLFGSFMVSLPYFNYGGICTEGEQDRTLLFRRAVELCREAGAAHLELRQTGPMAGHPVRTAKVSMRLQLPETPAALWDSFPAKLRSQVRRPSKEGMYATVGRDEELDGFYTVFANTMRDLGTPVYSRQFFENILRYYPASWVCMVRTARQEPVAGGILVGFKDVLEIPWASSLRRYNRSSPNMLLYSTALSFACEEGYRVFDFGRSSIGGSTYRFKEQWGARPEQLYWHYWMKDGKNIPELNPDNPRYRAAIALWKRLPVGLTKLIGPSIVKNLP